MNNNSHFHTYLFISSKKFIISVYNGTDLKSFFRKEMNYENNFSNIDFDKLMIFLDENIFEIEKKLKNFIKNIFVIIDDVNFSWIKLSMKKKNYGEFITTNDLKRLVGEAKNDCEKSIQQKKIIHLLIDNYLIDQKSFSNFPEGKRCDNYSIDIRFITLSEKYVEKLEQILRKYQISIDQIIYAKYLYELFDKDNLDLFEMANKVINNYNQNEVKIVQMSQKNKGFFEKFFEFFS